MQGTAVSKTIHRHPASKLASADVLLSTTLAGLTLQKRKNRENRSINDDVNVNLRLKLLFILSGWDTKIPVMLQCTVVDALQGWKGGKLENLFQR